jgi:hypothetical protein
MENKELVFCTMGWDAYPTTCNELGMILPREAEMIINSRYYPKGEIGEYPVNPETGELLPVWRYVKAEKPKITSKDWLSYIPYSILILSLSYLIYLFIKL